MKKRVLALTLCVGLLLSGCKTMLERSYSEATPHADRPAAAESAAGLRVENYQELVSAILYLVTQRAEEGTVQLYNYDGDEEGDLTAACLEVSTQDPLGAYAVEYIKHELSRVVSYYQATLAIRYRRSQRQMDAIAPAAGSAAIRDRLQSALSSFDGEVVLQTSAFFGDGDRVKELLREAYYADPASALGLPEAEVKLYPDVGRERIVEVLLEYPEDAGTLREKKEALERRAEALFPGDGEPAQDLSAAAREAMSALWRGPEEGKAGEVYDAAGGSTAYAAIVEGRADSQGMALGYALLCRRAGVDCTPVEGMWEEQSWWWDRLTDGEGNQWFVDPAHAPERRQFWFEAEDFAGMGYFSEET